MQTVATQFELFEAAGTAAPSHPPCVLHNPHLDQWFTPAWAAQAIVERHFSHLRPGDIVIEPSCGDGAFLAALPLAVNAIGVEVDPRLATEARRRTGRTVICGDFRHVALPRDALAMIGNPPFRATLIEQFLDRSFDLLQENGTTGLILPAYVLQTSGTVMRLNAKWGIEQEMLPRNLFPRLSLPLVFALFRKEPLRRLIGFFLYKETTEIALASHSCQAILVGHRRGDTWRAVTRFALEVLGGEATLANIYSVIEPRRPSTSNRTWEARVRNVLQLCSEFEAVSRGRWRLRPQ